MTHKSTDKKYTVLQLLPALNEGGIERGALEMGSFIAQKGGRSLIASAGGRMTKDADPQITFFTLPLNKRTPLNLYLCALRLAHLIRKENVDIVHARSRFPAWVASLACTWTKTPYVATYHGTHSNQNAFKKWYNSAEARADRVIAISTFIKNYIQENFQTPKTKIDLAYRGFDSNIFNPDLYTPEVLSALKQKHNIPEEMPILNLTGRLTRWKGHLLLLDVLAEIKDLPWVCLFIGSAGKKRTYLEEIKNKIKTLGLENRILFLENQSNPAPFYAMSTLAFSMATQPEAFGRISVEAQAMGTPIFATALGGSLETVLDEKTGFLVDPNNATDMAKILRKALKNTSLLNKMKEKARTHALKHFTINQMCQSEWESYTKCFQQNTTPKKTQQNT